MIRRAVPEDAEALEGFLSRHAASSMFLRGNIASHGTQEMVHRHGTTFFVKHAKGGIEAVAGVTNGGYLMCQAPDQPFAFWKDLVACMKGRTVAGITGDPGQTQVWIDALKIELNDFKINEVEPLFEVMLEDISPVGDGKALRRPTEADGPMLALWFAGYQRDTGLMPAGARDFTGLAEGFINHPDAQILVASGQAVAMTSINARAVDTVQVGGVYVPPEHRGRGYGGTVVALHLSELAKTGMRRAVLFAASDFAARAYQAIGFRQVGEYRVGVLKAPMVVGDVSVAMSLRER